MIIIACWQYEQIKKWRREIKIFAEQIFNGSIVQTNVVSNMSNQKCFQIISKYRTALKEN